MSLRIIDIFTVEYRLAVKKKCGSFPPATVEWSSVFIQWKNQGVEGKLKYATFGVKMVVRVGDLHTHLLTCGSLTLKFFLETLLLFPASHLLKCARDSHSTWISCRTCSLFPASPPSASLCFPHQIAALCPCLAGFLCFHSPLWPTASRREQCRGQNYEINDGFKSNLQAFRATKLTTYLMEPRFHFK